MTTPNVHGTCNGTCHPQDRIASVRDLAAGIADDRERRQFIGNCSGPDNARTVPFDTGVMHGPGRAERPCDCGYRAHAAGDHAILARTPYREGWRGR